MSFPKIILIGSVAVFAIIGVTALVKKMSRSSAVESVVSKAPPAQPAIEREAVAKPVPIKAEAKAVPQKTTPAVRAQDDFPNIDRVHQLFTTGPLKLPIVETISYSSRVPWLKGRPAWVADYAVYYGTSRHFIARSLNGKPDYVSQKVGPGSHFNVFRKDKRLQFHLLVDLARCKMGLYYYDLDTNERVLLKTYRVGVGRVDGGKPSGTLTPLGKYALGNKLAIYKPETMGYFHEQQTEMITVFGTRWIPFEHELAGAASAPSKGYGIHGAPWVRDQKTGQLVEDQECIGTYGSDGSIRLATADVEELFSIVISKPAFVEIVRDFHDAKLPGVEVATPRR